MWTTENRGGYERRGLRYPSDLTDAEWSLLAPLIPPARHGGRRRTVDVRAVIDGLLYVLETSARRARNAASPGGSTRMFSKRRGAGSMNVSRVFPHTLGHLETNVSPTTMSPIR